MHTPTKLLMRPVSALVPYARNARVHGEAQILQLRASIREFGFVAPCLIDGQDNLIAGHGRLLAALAEGIEEVPCVLVEHLTETQRKAYILADNRLAEAATWDAEMVSLELSELRDAGFDLDLTGFGEEDIVLEDSTDVEEDEDFDPTLPEVPKSVRGEIYQLGRHRVMCGDATSLEDVRALMEGAAADLLLTDPPYNVGLTGGTAEALTMLNDDFADEAEFREFLRAAFSCARRAMAPGASFYIWHADGEPGLSFRSACKSAGLAVRQCLVWIKQVATLGRQDYHWQHEPCLHGQTDPEPGAAGEPDDEAAPDPDMEHLACLYGWKDGRAHLWTSDRKQTTVLCFDRPSRSAEHPAMKPVKLFAYQMRNSTRPGARVLDPFAGSGTALVAAEQTDRTAYLMDLDPRCVDVILARWEAFTGQKAELVTG